MTTERELRIDRVRAAVRDVVRYEDPDQTRVELLAAMAESLCDDLEIAYRRIRDLISEKDRGKVNA